MVQFLTSNFLSLSKTITDYNAEDEDMVDPDLERREAEIDDIVIDGETREEDLVALNFYI